MPPNGIIVRRSQYPENGWSSWFGGYVGIKYPSARPYAITVMAKGSTGIFTDLNKPVKFIVDVESFTTGGRYVSTVQPPVSILPMQVNITLAPSGITRFDIIWYIEGGAPLFLYGQTTDATWANSRKKVFLPGPGPPPLPLLSKVGDVVEIQPYNKKGFGQLN